VVTKQNEGVLEPRLISRDKKVKTDRKKRKEKEKKVASSQYEKGKNATSKH
jgi:hypothetical protein